MIRSEDLGLKAMREQRGHGIPAMSRLWSCSEENLRQLERRPHVRPATALKYLAILDELDEERAVQTRLASQALFAAGLALIKRAEALLV